MVMQAPLITEGDIAAAYDWWKLAGVDVDALDEPSGWLDVETRQARTDATEPVAPPPAKKPAPAAPRSPQVLSAGISSVGTERPDWPAELSAFQKWWVEDENFARAGAFPRIAPRGPAAARLMILLPQPEEQDTETLFSGPLGALVSGFLRAAGLAQKDVYFASVLPRHTLQPDWDEVRSAGYGELCAHHIALAAPERIICFGRLVMPLLPHESAQEPAILRKFNHDGRSIPLLPARDVANLLRRPGFRARFWQQWLEFTDS